MGKLSKKKRATVANVNSRWHPQLGKNPSILDMKFESSMCKLVNNRDPFLPSLDPLAVTPPQQQPPTNHQDASQEKNLGSARPPKQAEKRKAAVTVEDASDDELT